MSRRFADLRLACPFSSLEEARFLLERAKAFGYKLVALPVGPEATREELQALKAAADEVGIDLATRVDLAPGSRQELLSALRRLRRRFELVGVVCRSREVARVAARDRRVDLLLFPLRPRQRFFDRSEAELASGSNCALEIPLMPLLRLPRAERIALLGRLREEISLARRYGVPVVLSSGAEEPMLMRRPRELAYLASILGLSLEEALDALSEVPSGMVERNRAKLDPSFIAPGIRVVRWGRDCP